MNYAVSLLKEIITKRKLIWDLGKADSETVVGSTSVLYGCLFSPL